MKHKNNKIITKFFFNFVTLPSRLKNRVLNVIFSRLCGSRIRIIWSQVKIVGFEKIQFGNNFSAGRGLWLELVGNRSNLKIGNNVTVSDWVHIGVLEQVTVGDGCLIGSKVIITDHSHGTSDDICGLDKPIPPNLRSLHSKGPIIIGDAVWLGDGVAVLSGVMIGSYAIIGANSVVTCDVPKETVWAGVPAKQVWPKAK